MELPGQPSISRGERARRLAKLLLRQSLVPVALVFVLLEATVWRWLAALGRLLARLPIFVVLERLVERLSPRAVIAVFFLPFVPIIPLLKIGQLWLLANHHYFWAAVVIVGGKVLGAAFSTRVYAIARPKMIQVHWFARLEGQVIRLLLLGHELLEGIPAWVAARAFGRRLRDAARHAGAAAWQLVRRSLPRGQGFLGRQWAAAMRRVRLRRP